MKELSNEEINRKIAEILGWHRCPTCLGWAPPLNASVEDSECQFVLPDYCSDLNAMAEAEKTLIDPDFNAIQHRLNDYASNLVSISMDGRNHYSFMATAHQRALAFLKTVAPKL